VLLPRNRRAIIIGGSIATHLKLLEAMGSIIERHAVAHKLSHRVADFRVVIGGKPVRFHVEETS